MLQDMFARGKIAPEDSPWKSMKITHSLAFDLIFRLVDSYVPVDSKLPFSVENLTFVSAPV